MGLGHFVSIVYTLTGHGAIFNYVTIKPHTSTRATGFAANMGAQNPCHKKDDRLLYRKRYKIIVGSATDKKECLLYRDEGDLL